MSEVIAEQRRPTVCKNSAIDEWLAERNLLIILYCKLSGKRNSNALPCKNQINEFCDVLIDYVSAGHFEVYEQIVANCQVNGHSSLALLESLYPQITKTTDVVVSFNDRYSQIGDEALLSHLDQDLSLLGEAIAKRVELEDQLIDTLKIKH